MVVILPRSEICHQLEATHPSFQTHHLLQSNIGIHRVFIIIHQLDPGPIKSFKKTLRFTMIYHSSPTILRDLFQSFTTFHHSIPPHFTIFGGCPRHLAGRQDSLARPKGPNRRASTWTPPAWAASCGLHRHSAVFSNEWSHVLFCQEATLKLADASPRKGDLWWCYEGFIVGSSNMNIGDSSWDWRLGRSWKTWNLRPSQYYVIQVIQYLCQIRNHIECPDHAVQTGFLKKKKKHCGEIPSWDYHSMSFF